uniref:Uncharacterized protein n=1 Tax=Wuchereria bancrofti TaxID=6293 RepID=A0A1I8EDX0_WUCBA
MQQENHEAEPTVSELFHTPEVEGLPKIIPTVPCQLRNIDPYEALKGWRIHAIKTHLLPEMRPLLQYAACNMPVCSKAAKAVINGRTVKRRRLELAVGKKKLDTITLLIRGFFLFNNTRRKILLSKILMS